MPDYEAVQWLKFLAALAGRLLPDCIFGRGSGRVNVAGPFKARIMEAKGIPSLTATRFSCCIQCRP